MYHSLIIGGGHNGLTCAAYLAQAGKSVLVLERRDILGGAAVTEEFHPGFKNSSCSYTVSLLNPAVMAELSLADHGLKIVKRRINNFFPTLDGSLGLRFFHDEAAQRAEIARLSAQDAAHYDRFNADLDMAAGALKRLLTAIPPNPKGGLRDLFRAIRLGLDLNRQTLADQRILMRLATDSASDFLKRYFSHPQVLAAFAFDGIVGTFAGPDTPGTAYVLLHHCFGEATGEPGVWGHAIGGMGAISNAIWAAAKSAGAEARTGAEVTNILTHNSRAVGVKLADGAEIFAKNIICGATPHVMHKLLPDAALSADDHVALDDIQYHSATLRMNIALSALPNFPNASEQELSGGLILAPDMAYLRDAFTSAQTGGWSDSPIIEMLIPSLLDDTLAPKGQHVASLFCQHFPYDQAEGWDAVKDRAVKLVLDTLERFAPGTKGKIIGLKALTPLDLERDYALTRGDIFHGSLSLSQLYAARPALGMAGYKMPVKNLYLCGSGAHPGGGVTGVPGRNCAQVVLGRG